MRSLWSVILIAVLAVALATPARASNLQTDGDLIEAGIAVVAAAVAVVIIVLVIHNKHKNVALTGCVIQGPTGISVKDEKDQRIYLLKGNQAGVKTGDRMTLEGRRKRTTFETHRVTGDLGACQP